MPLISALIKDFESTDSTSVETTSAVHVPGGVIYGELELVVATTVIGTGDKLDIYVQSANENAYFRDYACFTLQQAHTASPTAPLVIRYPIVPPATAVAGTGGSDGAMASSTVSTSLMAGAFWRVREKIGTTGGTWNYRLTLYRRKYPR